MSESRVSPGLAAEASFPPRPDSAGAARRWVDNVLAQWGVRSPPDLGLVVGELAANAVRHAGTTFVVAVTHRDRTIRVEVCDESRELPRAVDFVADATSGRGIVLVRALGSRSGVDLLGEGKRVWVELLEEQ